MLQVILPGAVVHSAERRGPSGRSTKRLGQPKVLDAPVLDKLGHDVFDGRVGAPEDPLADKPVEPLEPFRMGEEVRLK